MKICATFGNFNPFHNGHLYHFVKSKERSKSDCLIVFTPGSFTNLGEAMIEGKENRAKWLLSGGADLVFEIPLIYCLSNFNDYVGYVIKALKPLGNLTLSFGTDFDNLEDLQNNRIQEGIVEKDFNLFLNSYNENKNEIKSNKIFENKVKVSEKNESKNNDSVLLSQMLIEKLNADIMILTVKKFFSDKSKLFSYSEDILKRFYNGEDISKSVPKFVKFSGINEKKMEEFCFNQLNAALKNNEEYLNFKEGLKEKIERSTTLNEFLSLTGKAFLKTNAYKAALSSSLKIKQEDLVFALKIKPYYRILASNEKGNEVVNELKAKSLNVFANIIECSKSIKKIASFDDTAASLLQNFIKK